MDDSTGMVFRARAPYMFMVGMLGGGLLCLSGQAVLVDSGEWPPAGLVAVVVAIHALIFGGLMLALHGRNSIQVTGPALVLVVMERAVVIPWQAVESAVTFGNGPSARLQVTLRPGAGLPLGTTLRPRLRAGKLAYIVDASMIRHRDLLDAELARHLSQVTARPDLTPPGASARG